MLLLSFCDKEQDPPSEGDPSSLAVEVLSIDHGSGHVIIQASAIQAVEFQLFIGDSPTPAEVNNTGYFEYTFEGPGDYTIEVRAYGSSGRYVKQTALITIEPENNTPVPLDSGYFSPLEYPGYTLEWQEDFSGTSLDTETWNYDIGDGCPNCGWGNNELQYYRAENATVGDGVLTIEAKQETFGGRNYTSSRLTSQGKRAFRYGRIDIRALLPEGKGIWPALWMLGGNIGSVGWPACGEIDIMEMVGGGSAGDKTCYGTIHWDDGQGHASYGGDFTLPSGTFSSKYHVFSITWDENSIKWYVNDQHYHTVNITETHMTEFHQEFFFILNVAVGGNWPGNPDATTRFPQQMKVDYIRVFQEN